jgi:hypothetical protein
MNKITQNLITSFSLMISLSTTRAIAETNLFIYPKAGQTPQQQSQDQETCQQWAIAQTSFDPKPIPLTITQSPFPSNNSHTIESQENTSRSSNTITRFKDDPLFGRITRVNPRTEQQRWEEYQQQQRDRQDQIGRSDYNRAFISCMAAKNYEIR